LIIIILRRKSSPKEAMMSFIKAVKFCRLCAKEKGGNTDLIDIVIDSLGDSAEAWEEFSSLRSKAELLCLDCKGKEPAVAKYLEIEYVLPVKEALKREERKEKKISEERIKKQERREMHKRIAPGKVLDLSQKKEKKG
jgi:hypothetical protein